LCPTHLTLQDAVLCVTCSLLCRSLICASVLVYHWGLGVAHAVGRESAQVGIDVREIRQVCVAELDTGRVRHDCDCLEVRWARAGWNWLIAAAWKLRLELKRRATFGFLRAETLCPFVTTVHTTLFQLPAEARHIAFTQTHHGGSSPLHRTDVTATMNMMCTSLWLRQHSFGRQAGQTCVATS
jgi:hypothetical protein